MTYPIPTPIYHITDIQNLPSIVAQGGLYSWRTLRRTRIGYRNMAYQKIQNRRSRYKVPCGPGGTLHDYVPFYFAPRSPMLYTIHKGNVPNYNRNQSQIIHLVSMAQDVQKAGLGFVFTDGHAIMKFSQYFDDLSQLPAIDWHVMKSKYWNDTIQQPDRKRRRQAEFLVYNVLPWKLISYIGVMNNNIKQRVIQLLAHTSHTPVIQIQRKWYY